MLTELHGSWLGPLEAPRQYRVAAHLEGLALTAGTPARQEPWAAPACAAPACSWRPPSKAARRGWSCGTAALSCPASLKTLCCPSTSCRPACTGDCPRRETSRGAYEFALQDLKLQTPDARGEFELRWHRARDATGPGTIDLSGQLDGLAAARVARYMPLSLPARAAT